MSQRPLRRDGPKCWNDLAAADRAESLLYGIRKEIGRRNATAGINDLLADRARLEARRRHLERLVARSACPLLRVLGHGLIQSPLTPDAALALHGLRCQLTGKEETAMPKVTTQKITPFLWFDDKAEEAANFYVSIFKNSHVGRVTRYGDAGPGPKGTVMSVVFQLEGQEFFALNGGPQFTFTPAISFFVTCETQQEVDELWEKLSAGGRKDRCGWLQDKYGLSWQVVPSALGRMLGDKDPKKAQRVMTAMMQMDKIDINGLQQAYDGARS